MTEVAYVTLHESVPARPLWDQALLGQTCTLLGWSQRDGFDPAPVVAVPARMNWTRESEFAARLGDWPVRAFVVTSDEEGRFSWRAACPQSASYWIQTSCRPLGEGESFVPLGAPPHSFVSRSAERDFTWCFAGQVTHERRRAAVNAAQSVPGGLLVASDRFAAGLPPEQYLSVLGRSRVVPCPSGPVHPETFRLYEALESGCVPVADARTPNGVDWSWWWDEHYPTRPFPVVQEWAELPDLAPGLLTGWQHQANRCTAWWKQRKAQFAHDLAAVVGDPHATRDITVIVTMSPIPSHPSLDVLAETIQSLWEWGPAADVIVACDGVRPEDEPLRDRYEQAVAELCWRALHDPDWVRVRPVLADRWVHQAGAVRLALAHVRTPLLLFAEHDTPLCGPVPWDDLAKIVLSGDANVIRLAHETHVHDEHRHLFIGDGPSDVSGVPLWRTVQFSARPHLAGVDWYQQMLARHFPPDALGFCEDRFYGPITERPWEAHRLFLYAPGDNYKRSWHLDGRAGAEKAPAYIP